MNPKEFREFVITLLNDDNGVNYDSYQLMYLYIDRDICDCVKSIEGRYYISIEDADNLRKEIL